MLYALRTFWRVSRGYRLHPWRSPYLHWRLETFLGSRNLPPHLSAREFFRILWRHRQRLASFLRWARETERLTLNS